MKLVKVKVALVEGLTAALSALITFVLMENSGVDLFKGNLFSFETFPIHAFILGCICLHFFRKNLTKLIKFISIFIPSNEIEKTKT